jgi:hypothetical protein
MYLQNKYLNIYNNIIERAKSRTLEGYKEKHHIVPKSIGGTDEPENLVELTSKEHYLCHRILTKITEGENKRKMIYAMKIMTTNCHGHRYVPAGRVFEYVREESRKSQIGVPLSEDRKMKISKSLKGKKQSEETKRKRAEKRLGLKHSEETKKKMSQSALGRKQTPEAIDKIKNARAKQKIVTIQVICPHCGKEGGNRIMPRYHFDNCKFKDVYR